MAFVVMKYRRGGDDPKLKVCPDYDKAVAEAHKFFMSFDFSLQDGQPFDHGALRGQERTTLSQVKMHKGKVAEFVHREGDGPVCRIEKA
jgi:hypothetical protein